jgi:molybdenum cofactor cytidylyltransferase
MELIDAVQLTGETSLALVGAGGKTTAMFRLGKQWAQRTGTAALLTTTTHLATSELQAADHHIEVGDQTDLAALLPQITRGVVLVTGPEVEDGRVGGLLEDSLEVLHSFAREHRLPLIIEADGSAQKPLKAPADHEPVIPGFVDTVIVVVGMQAVGKKLNDIWVHRVGRYSELTGLGLNETITIDSVAKMLLSPTGGLKSVLQNARKFVLFNQCDSARLTAAAKLAAGQLLERYQRVVYAALQVEGSQEVIAASHPVAGLLLAAGESKRMGQPKQLLDWRGVPFVRSVAETALQSELSPVVVVTGAYAEEVEQALEGLDVQIVRNPLWAEGQSTSMIAGLNQLPPETQAVVMMLADQPQIPHSLVDTLVENHAAHFSPIVATMVDHRRGNPVLFDRRTFPALFEVTGDAGGRKIFSKFRVQYVPWLDSRIALDVDSMEDYHNLLDQWQNS